ncbi:cation-transporting ATPase E [Nakamurella flavida]|uniref:HAD-IC family P-type ATPase n=1 Tax=Nakamurella flavida TaxID=363630 RepID=UPI00278A3AB2|nr:HAD-IC family P-type ATPase [Nakamurella flavida]MDP9776944.1 cation-transporting ATPase E [Nakamurella flavida]
MTTPSRPPGPVGAPADPAPAGAEPALATSPHGLTSAEVAQRVARGEINVTDNASSRSLWAIVRTNVFTRFNAILGALFVLILITGSVADGLFGVVLIVNSLIGIVQEYLAKRKLDRLALLNAPTTRVVRDGELVEIPTAQVVLGDLIELRTGDQVPADGTVVSSAALEINESNLTGESDAMPKAVGDPVLSGTVVVAGSGRFPAAAVGAQAYANKIAAEAKVFTRTRSEIQSSVNTLLKYITWIIVVALPLQLWSQSRAIGDQGWREVIIRSTGGLVGLVPEGLVLLTSVAFLLAAVSLTRQQVLVQELPAVEGLARVDVVCLDKTGTLTVGDIVFEDLLPLDVYENGDLKDALGALADDPNANGTLQAVAHALPAPAHWERRDSVAFNSARKWSAAEFAGRETWVMGAPDVLLAEDDPIRERVGELATTGRRVLLLSNTDQQLSGTELPGGLVHRALVVLSEQVRPDAKDTLNYFREQGVTIKIISGDNPTTVAAIARRVGLDVTDEQVVDARTLGEDPEELREIVERTTVFGRVSPEQKRSLVRALRMNGHVAAMTGDGVNDALALKDADIGVAMGNGAQATKAVAQLVLLDGKFSHLPAVLAEGRRVIGNVERVANLFVAKNVMSLVAIVSAALFALPFPFLPRHLTLVSAVTIGIPAFFLALGPNKRRYVPGFLTRVLRFAVPAGVVAGLVVLTSYLLARAHYGVPAELRRAVCALPVDGVTPENPACWQPSTAATISLLCTAFWILVVLARPFRPWKVALVGTMVGVAVLAFVLPIGQRFFEFSAPLPLLGQSLLVGAGGALLVELVYRQAPGMRRAAGS